MNAPLEITIAGKNSGDDRIGLGDCFCDFRW
jgi:hypothetical protein